MRQDLEKADDAELVRRSVLGQGDAFAVLVRRYADDVYRLIRFTARLDSHRVEDVAQEVFLAAWRALEGYRGEAPFRLWLLRIAVNTAHKAVRWSRARPDRPFAGGAGDRAPEPADEAPPPWERLVREETVEAVVRELERLDEPLRLAVVLRDVEGLSYGEIAAVLDVPIGTVRSRIHRGREAIRRALEERPARALEGEER